MYFIITVTAAVCLQEQPKQPEPHKNDTCCHASSAFLFLFLCILQNKQIQHSPFPKQSRPNCFYYPVVNEAGGCSAENVWKEQESLDPQFTQ